MFFVRPNVLACLLPQFRFSEFILSKIHRSDLVPPFLNFLSLFSETNHRQNPQLTTEPPDKDGKCIKCHLPWKEVQLLYSQASKKWSEVRMVVLINLLLPFPPFNPL